MESQDPLVPAVSKVTAPALDIFTAVAALLLMAGRIRSCTGREPTGMVASDAPAEASVTDKRPPIHFIPIKSVKRPSDLGYSSSGKTETPEESVIGDERLIE